MVSLISLHFDSGRLHST